ncbi:MAG TPA: type II secretion system protein GspG [Polyangiaceae bacterium]|nr:type II secretion system protein GspG [Polyangiaceae bacterium]
MILKRESDRRILFPWEGRGGLRRFIELGRVRPIALGLLIATGLVLIGVHEHREAGIRRTRATLLGVRPAIEAYMADHDGGCPPALSVLPEQYARFKEPPSDAWGHPLRLICPADALGKSYVLESGGPDGEPGGLDRIQ